MAITNQQPFNDYNSMISYYAQQYGQSEDTIRDAFSKFKTDSRREADKNRVQSEFQDKAKDYIKDRTKENTQAAGTQGAIAGGQMISTPAAQAAYNAAANEATAQAASNMVAQEGASEASQAAWNAGADAYAQDVAAEQAGELGAAQAIAGAAALYQGGKSMYEGAKQMENSQKNDNEGVRSAMATYRSGACMIAGAIIGTICGGNTAAGALIGQAVGAIGGNAEGYVVDKFHGDPRIAAVTDVGTAYIAKKAFGLGAHKSDSQKREERHNRLLKDENNSYKAFTEQSADADRNAQIKANQDKAYAATPDGYVGWWDDPNTEGNEWTWVNKSQKPEHYKLDDEAYINTLGSGDIMFMPTFFENIPNWNELSMDQKDKIASKALELGKRNAGTKKGIYARAGEMDLGKNLWEGELGDYAKRVIEGTDTEEERAMANGNNNSSGNNTSGNTSGFATLTYGQQGYPVGVVGNIFFPGDGSKPIYIGNYNKDKNISLANTLAKLKNDRQNAWGNVGKSFLAAYLGLDEDKKKKEKDDDVSLLDWAKIFNGDTGRNNSVLDLYGSNNSAPATIDDLFTTPDFDYRYQ